MPDTPVLGDLATVLAGRLGYGLTLVAEGVEDHETADILTAAGFDLLQGYHFGRPVPPDRLGAAVPA